MMDCVQILFGNRNPQANHMYEIWWQLVKRFRVGGRSSQKFHGI